MGKLAEAIDVYTLVDADAYPADRSLSGWTKEARLDEFIANAETTTVGRLEAGKSATLGIALKMREEAGNEYQGLTLGDFDIQILTAQDTVENDSFGDNQYDKDAAFDDGVPMARIEVVEQGDERFPEAKGEIQILTNLNDWNSRTLDIPVTAHYVYEFSAPDDEITVQESPYKEWIADYYVSFSKGIKANSAGLIGNYDPIGWIGFTAPQDIPEGQEPIALLGLVGMEFTYEDICESVRTFLCGAFNCSDENNETEMTVELRLTNPDNSNEYKVISSITKAFGAPQGANINIPSLIDAANNG